MGKRKDPKRRKILQLKSTQESYTQIWPRNNPVPQSTNQGIKMNNGNLARNNALSGLLSHYMDCDDDEDDDSDDEQGKNPETENSNSNSNPHSIALEVADFLKEIDAITSDETSDQKEEIKTEAQEDRHIDGNQWQECVDETTGYTYYWNVVSNEVTWEYPKTATDIVTSGPVTAKKPTPTVQKSIENVLRPVEVSPEIIDDGKIVPITFYGPGSSNGGSSNGESSNEEADSPSLEKSKMGPHLPPVEEFELSTNKVFESPDERSKSPVEEQTEEPDSTTRAKQTQQIKEVISTSNLFCGPPNAAQVLASSLDDESDAEEISTPLFLPSGQEQMKHKGFGFGLQKKENGIKGSKSEKAISFVKAETLDLNAINRNSVNEWENGKQEKIEIKVELEPKVEVKMEPVMEIKMEEDGEVEIDVDRELDLALERNVKDDVTQLANGIFNQLERLGVNSTSVSNLQKLYIETQTRLEDFRQRALKRSYLLTKLRQIESHVEELHQLHTCKDRTEGEINQPDTTGINQQTPSVVSSSTALFNTTVSSVEVPPLPPPPLPESPPPPPPDSTAHESGVVTTMEIDDPIEGTQLEQQDMQMELNSFYSDIGKLSEAETPAASVITPLPSTSGLSSVVTTVPSVSSSETSTVTVMKKEKKLKKARMSTGLVLKKKNMPFLVEKWQKIKRDEARNASSSDDEKGGVSTTRHHSDD